MKPSSAKFIVLVLAFAVALVLAWWWIDGGWSGEREAKQEREEAPLSAIGLDYLRSRTIGSPVEGRPWITDLAIVDLDRDGLLDIVATEARPNRVVWIQQRSDGGFEEVTLNATVAGPAHVEVVDLDQDGDNDVLVSSMGIVTPNDQEIGAVVALENVGDERFRERVLLDQAARVTYGNAADFDGDGDLDLSVGQFGYFEGEIRWMENLGDWEFASHSLLALSGTIHAPPADIDGDGDVDIVALVSQDWEEIHVFDNDGQGNFTSRVVYGSTNRDFGSSGIRLADIDLDGDLDIAYTNGDGFDYATPGARPWHGVQWLENDGSGHFAYRRIGDLSGAYSPLVVDIDGDGDMDVIATSGFNDWTKGDAVSLMCFENDGSQSFSPRPLARVPTHLVVVDGADMDGNGFVELVTGGFHFYPPFENTSRVSIWERRSR